MAIDATAALRGRLGIWTPRWPGWKGAFGACNRPPPRGRGLRPRPPAPSPHQAQDRWHRPYDGWCARL